MRLRASRICGTRGRCSTHGGSVETHGSGPRSAAHRIGPPPSAAGTRRCVSRTTPCRRRGARRARPDRALAGAEPWLFPSKAFLPVSISNSTAPNAKMSLRTSASLPSSCPGAMYWKVPRIAPCAVRSGGVVGSVDNVAPGTVDAPIFASPKSSSFAPDFVSMMLPGLRSR